MNNTRELILLLFLLYVRVCNPRVIRYHSISSMKMLKVNYLKVNEQ